MCVCVSVCQCVGTVSAEWKFGTGIDLDGISREFDGQVHRSKVKIIQLKKVIREFWPRLSDLYLT